MMSAAVVDRQAGVAIVNSLTTTHRGALRRCVPNLQFADCHPTIGQSNNRLSTESWLSNSGLPVVAVLELIPIGHVEWVSR